MNKYNCKGRNLLALSCVLLLIAITFFGFIESDIIYIRESGTAETIQPGTASVLNLSERGAFKNNFMDALQGGQSEDIYYGSNFVKGTYGNSGAYAHTGAIKWRVLSKSDSRYGDGSTMLLWSDYILGKHIYNSNYTNPHYAFWGTGEIRAQLNGGSYLEAVSNSTASPDLNQNIELESSWFYQLFSAEERAYVVPSSNYETKKWGYNTPTPYCKTVNIVGAGSGQYSTTVLGATGGAAKYVTTNTSSVIETTGGDNLFILDYYDINNLDYGFGDDGKVYANYVKADWTEESGFFPCKSDSTAKAAYLQYSGDIAANYWIRNAGRASSRCGAFYVTSGGVVAYINVADLDGIRPAFNLSPSSIIYATASSVEPSGSTLTSVSAVDGYKPAYKVYLKSSDYKNFNEDSSNAPSISKTESEIVVTKQGQTGDAIILLSDKSGNGEVSYQAATSFENGVAKVNIPSGLEAKNYIITVLFVDSIIGENYTETVTGSYSSSGIEIPKDVTVTYNGKVRTLADFANESWYDAEVFDNSAKMTVSIPSNAIHSGSYNVTFTLVDSQLKWADGTKTQKTMTLKIETKPVGLIWSTSDEGVHTVTVNIDDVCDEDKGEGKLAVVATRYRGRSGNSYDSLDPPRKIGAYTSIAELQNNDYVIKSGETTSKNFDLQSIKVPMLTASNFSPANSQEYNGSNSGRTFMIINYNDYRLEGSTDDKPVEISIPNDLKNIMTFVGGVINAKGGARTYKLLLKLTDPINTEWSDRVGQADNTADREVEFYITQKDLTGNIIDPSSGSLSVGLGQTATLTLEMEDGNYPFGEDEINIDVYAYMSGVSNGYLVASDVILVNGEHDYSIEIDTAILPIMGDYTLKFEVRQKEGTANSNYKVMIGDISLTVTEGGDDVSNITWRLRDENNKQVGSTVRIPIGTLEAKFATDITYSKGKSYTFTVSFPEATHELDTSAEGGFVAGYKDRSFSKAGKHITQVKIRNKTTQEIQIYSIEWEITPAMFDLSKVKWKEDGKIVYTGSEVEMTLEGLPEGLSPIYTNNKSVTVGAKGFASVSFERLSGDYDGNYFLPIDGNVNSYIGSDFKWSIEWEIASAVIAVGSNSDWILKSHTDDNGNTYDIYVLKDTKADGVVEYEFYEADNKNNIIGTTPLSLEELEYSPTQVKYYKVLPKIIDVVNYKFSDGVSEENLYSPFFTVGGGATAISVSIASDKIEYNGKPRNVKLVISGSGATLNDFILTYYSGDIVDEAHKLEGAPTERGNYLVVITSNKNSVVLSGTTQYTFEIIAATIKKEWNKNAKPYVLNLKYGQIDGIEYEIADAEGNPVEYSQLSAGNKYQIKAVIKEEMRNNYSFSDGTYETAWEEFELRAEDIPNMQDPNDPNNTYYPQDEEDNDPDNNNPSGDINSGNTPGGDKDIDLGAIGKFIKSYWREIASGISIVLIIIFLSKTASNESKRKRAQRTVNEKYKTYYATSVGLFGLATTYWTVIASVLMGLAAISLVMMIISQVRKNKAERELETSRDAYEQNKQDEMKAMLMRMMGGSGQGGYVQQGLGAEEMRGLISETVTAMLPGMQQMLPQQASTNDELVNKLLEKESDNDRLIEQLLADNARNQETMKSLIQQLAQQPVERVVEKEVVASNVNEELINRLIEQNEKLMQKLAEQQPQQEVMAQPQVIEKEVRVEVPVEKIVEVPVEKSVEKVVEKPIVISTEAVGEAEKSKQVKKTPAPKKAPAPRLTLEEAYAKLTKEQKKYFDGLREYAMSKDSKCKEKLSTYFTTIGPSTTNPFIKLTIKKGITVALFKMEDEYLKDIRRNASGDGTKVKVKETEVPIGDKQAYDTAKDMVDLRIDQIERYNDFLKEQRALRK